MQVPFKYTYRDTLVHRLHPLVKLLHVLLTLLLIITPLYSIRFLPVLAVWLALSVGLWSLARIEVSRFATLIKLLLGTFVFLITIQGFTYRFGDTVIVTLFQWGYGDTNLGALKLEGVVFGLLLSLRMLTAAASLPLFVMTTSSADLMTGLRKLHMPKVATLMVVSALSFTTLIFEMWAFILDAQKLRGFDINQMNIITRLRKAYVPIVTPLVLLLFRRANDFQIALETRGFGTPGNPTEVERLEFTVRDGVVAAFFVAVWVLCQYLRVQIAAGLG
jgi:energy-coupling factor transporter transmembrane protein EcfT